MWISIAIASALLSAAATIFEKASLRRIGALDFSLLISAALFVFSAGTAFKVDMFGYGAGTLGILVFKSVINAGAFLLVMMTLERCDISGSLPLLGLTPGFTALLAFFTIGDAITAAEAGGLLLMTAGVFLLEKKGSVAAGGWRGQWTIWAALLLFAVSSVLDKVLLGSRGTPPLAVMFWQHLVFLLMYLGLSLGKGRGPARALRETPREVYLYIAAAAVLTLGYRYTQLSAVKLAPVALVLAVKRTSVFFASLAGGKIFSEPRLLARGAAAGVIITAGFLILRNAG